MKLRSIEVNRPRAVWRLRELELLALVLIALIAGDQLFRSPVTGLGDNGDYWRVMNPVGVGYAEEQPVLPGLLVLDFAFIPRRAITIPSTQLLLAEIAAGMARLSGGEHFDLRWMAAVNLAAYLTALYFVMAAVGTLPRRARFVLLPLLVLATDAGYVSHFNSFYAESALLIYFVLCVGIALLALRGQGRGWPYAAAFFTAALLFIGAKPQNYPLALLLALVLLSWLGSSHRRFRPALVVPLALLLPVFALLMYMNLPGALKGWNRWNSMFYGVLLESPAPEADLAELGMDPELARFRGMSAFHQGVLVDEATAAYGHREIAGFYARHPGRLLAVSRRAARESWLRFSTGVGQFTADSGRAWLEQSERWSFWSHGQRRWLPAALWFLAAGFAALVVGAVRLLWVSEPGGAERRLAMLAVLLGAMAPAAFLVCIVGDGCYDLPKHLFAFHMIADCCVMLATAWLIGWAGTRLERRRNP